MVADPRIKTPYRCVCSGVDANLAREVAQPGSSGQLRMIFELLAQGGHRIGIQALVTGAKQF